MNAEKTVIDIRDPIVNKKNARRTVLDIKEPILQSLLRGGFVLPHDPTAGLVVLLRGKPGTGKSTLALQILDLLDTHKNAKRYYCTLEQSKEDVQFKLASMLVAQAINKSRIAKYSENRFTCKFNVFYKHLSNKLKRSKKGLKEELESQLQNISLHLYDEPDKNQREKCSEAEYTLSELVNNNLRDKRIFIRGSQYGENIAHSERPLHPASSHVMLTSRLLDDVLRKPPKETIQTQETRAELPIVVIDGLSLLSVSERGMLELKRIVDLMRRTCQIGIIVYEPDEEESTSLDHHADMVIELTRSYIERPLSYLIHQLSIRKARYQDAALGEHQFKIRSSGLAFFPSLHFQVHHYNYMDLELKRSSCDGKWQPTLNPDNKEESTCTQGSIIDMIFSPKPGESVVLLGSRNSFKTQLCLDFLVSGSWGCFKDIYQNEKERSNVEQGLLISLIDNAPDIERGLSCPWRKSRFGNECKNKCKNDSDTLISHASAFCQRPGCITPAEFFHYLSERVNILKKKAKEGDTRIVFWDLTQMDYRFPLFKEDKMLLPAMMDMFKTNKMKSLFMGAGNADNTRAASAMADHVLFCWRSNVTYKKKDDNSRTEEISKPSLMLYVDRTPAASHHAGKSLYSIPIEHDEERNDDKLVIPRQISELQNYLTSPATNKLHDNDAEMIKNITNMQGVA